jgi:hypothetical protein
LDGAAVMKTILYVFVLKEIFTYLLQNHPANFNRTLCKLSLSEGNSTLQIKGQIFQMEIIAEIGWGHLKGFFLSKTTGPEKVRFT